MLSILKNLKYHSFQDLIKNTSFTERKNLNKIMRIKIDMKQYNLDSYFWILFCVSINKHKQLNHHQVVELVLLFWKESSVRNQHFDQDCINAVFEKTDWFIRYGREKGFSDSFVQSFIQLYNDCMKK